MALAKADAVDRIDQARQQQLAGNPAWLDLLHMHRGTVTGVVSSEVDDDDFFLAATGKTDSQAEMDSTIRHFMDDASAACRFPARWQWLSQFLNLGDRAECAELDQWKQKLSAQQITLLFPSMYLQNPASMFGHTFLRFDQHQRSPLLAYTLSYAARPDKADNVLSYVYKGVLGGYPGVFAVQPYYQTVTDYGDIEHRDIWEYSLNLSANEIDQLLNHVWELRDKKIDYFFLRENCAYQLLALLNVARPGLDLTRKHFPIYAIPVDTVRRVQAAGLIDKAVYRPARASRVEKMFGQLNTELQTEALSCARDSECLSKPCLACAADDKQQTNNHARVLELAAEIQQLNNRDAEHILLQRSQLDAAAGWLPFTNDDPANGHASARWLVAAGKYEHRKYVELGLRPVLHDWLDNDAGLIEGAALEALSARVRYYSDEDRLQLQQLTLFSMQSYSPVTPWATPISSEMRIGMNRINNNKVYFAAGGLGLSVKIQTWHFFALADAAIEIMPIRQKSEALYVGAHAGVRTEAFSGQLLLQAKWQTSAAGYEETRREFNAGYQWNVSSDYAVRVEYSLRSRDDSDERNAQIGLLRYF